MLFRLRDLAEQHARHVLLNQQKGVLLFVSLSDGQKRAQAHHFFGGDFDQAWAQVVSHYGLWLKDYGSAPTWIRIDWARTVRQASLAQVEHWFKGVKRNYMRWGMVMGAQCQYAFTEQELNANAMLYQGARVPNAQINKRNFRAYGKLKYADFDYDFAPEQSVHLVDTAGVFISTEEGPYLLYRRGRNAGRRVVRQLDESRVGHLITTASQYLTQQVQPNGRFYYGWHPCFDREIRFYNTLRHASTVYSMIEAWEVTRCAALSAAIDRALQYVIERFVKYDQNNAGEQIAFLVEHDLKEIKLGANAVLILALTKYSEVFDTKQYLPLLEALALGIQWMQDPRSGQLTHVLNYPDLSIKEKFRVIYYDGEAAFGLMRLYGLTRDARWLAIVEKAFEYFIAAEHWKVHDHWLSYCVNELTRYKEEEKYYRFGIQNVAGHLDFVANRITTFPTLLELMMAAEQMVERLRQSEQYGHLLDELDQKAFYQALEKRARYLLNGYFAPEIAMYFANPQRILGSFFIRHHSFRVRIDDVEHYLSGYVAYLRYLKKKEKISAKDMLDATGGQWVIAPPANWYFSGACVAPAFFKSNDLLCAFGNKGKAGLREKTVKQLVPQGASAIMTEDGGRYAYLGKPILQVGNVRNAVLELGKLVRNRFGGTVIGISGSAGKTTLTHYLAYVLQNFGDAAASRGSANVPFGVSWNMCGMEQNASFWCVEMAIGNMQLNTEIVRPHIAVITNIAPAHLKYHESLENIAHRKARIFSGMPLGAMAVLFSDMPFYDVFIKAAQQAGVQFISFGESRSADISLRSLTKEEMEVCYFGESIKLKAFSHDRRDVYNFLAVLGVLRSLNLELAPGDGRFHGFVPVQGRNQQHRVEKNNHEFLLIDDAYNANPLSMEMALKSLNKKNHKKLLILGDMLELGADSKHFHEALLSQIIAANPERLILCGPEMEHLWQLFGKASSKHNIKKIKWFETVENIIPELDEWIPGQEIIFIKGSNSIHLSQLVNLLKS